MTDFEFMFEDRIAKIKAINEQLDVMSKLLPNERKQCEILWKPVYEEYRRIGYRLEKKDYVQYTIFDYEE